MESKNRLNLESFLLNVQKTQIDPWFREQTTITAQRNEAIQNFTAGILEESKIKDWILNLPKKMTKKLEPQIPESLWRTLLKQFLWENLHGRLQKSDTLKEIRAWTLKSITPYLLEQREMILFDICMSHLLFKPVLINLKILKIVFTILENCKKHEKEDGKKILEYIDKLIQELECKNFIFFSSYALPKRQLFSLHSSQKDREESVFHSVGLSIAIKRYSALTNESCKVLDEIITEVLSNLSQRVKETFIILNKNSLKSKEISISFVEETSKLALTSPSELFRYGSVCKKTFGQNKFFEEFDVFSGALIFDPSGLIFKETLPKTKKEFIELLLKSFQAKTEDDVLKTFLTYCDGKKYKEEEYSIFLSTHPEFQSLSMLTFNAFSNATYILKSIFPNYTTECDPENPVELMVDNEFGQPLFLDEHAVHLKRFIIRKKELSFLVHTQSENPLSLVTIDPMPHSFDHSPRKNRKNSLILSGTPRGSLLRTNTVGNIKVVTKGHSKNPSQVESTIRPFEQWVHKEFDFTTAPTGIYASILVSLELKLIPDPEKIMAVQGKIHISNIEVSPTAPFDVIEYINNSLQSLKEKIKIPNNLKILNILNEENDNNRN